MINTKEIDKLVGLILRIIFALLALPIVLFLFCIGLGVIFYLNAFALYSFL